MQLTFLQTLLLPWPRFNGQTNTENIYNVICLGEVPGCSYFLSFMVLYGGGDLIVINTSYLFFCLQKQRSEGRCKSRMMCNCSSWWLSASWNWTPETSVFLFVCCWQIAVKLPAKMGVLLPPLLSCNQRLVYEEKNSLFNAANLQCRPLLLDWN